MPEQETLDAARRDLEEGKSPSTAAGEFVKQEIDHVREGKHGVKNTKQAIAIGLSEARRAGVKLSPPKGASKAVREKAARDTAIGHGAKVSPTRSRGAKRAALTRERRHHHD